MSNTRTPIKAISSKISTKSTPSLPPPSHTYEPHLKAVLRNRLKRSLSVSAAYTYALINTWTLWQVGGTAKVSLWGALWLLISPRTMCITLVVWTIMALPVTVLRKLFLTCMCLCSTPERFIPYSSIDHRSTMSSPWNIVKSALLQKSTRIATVVHFVSSICMLFFLVINEYAYSTTDPKLTLFVKSRYLLIHFHQNPINNVASQKASSLPKRPPSISVPHSAAHRFRFCTAWCIDRPICLSMGNSGTPVVCVAPPN